MHDISRLRIKGKPRISRNKAMAVPEAVANGGSQSQEARPP